MMSTQRQMAIFLLGVWIGGSVLVAFVATQNFYTIDRLLQSPPNPLFQDALETVGPSETRELLRFLSSELNRLYFQVWNILQIPLALLTWRWAARIPGASKAKWGIIAMLGVVLVMGLGLMPQILSVGRSLDFVPRDPAPPGLRTFGLLHAAYTVMELLKLIIGVIVTISIVKISPQAPALHKKSGEAEITPLLR